LTASERYIDLNDRRIVQLDVLGLNGPFDAIADYQSRRDYGWRCVIAQ
jgi:hypothetical protein